MTQQVRLAVQVYFGIQTFSSFIWPASCFKLPPHLFHLREITWLLKTTARPYFHDDAMQAFDSCLLHYSSGYINITIFGYSRQNKEPLSKHKEITQVLMKRNCFEKTLASHDTILNHMCKNKLVK